VAHADAVNCLRIGRKSSGVLVTGGDDRKVNVWAIGKPNAILVGPCRAALGQAREGQLPGTRSCGAGGMGSPL
jgi:hypothetical protein